MFSLFLDFKDNYFNVINNFFFHENKKNRCQQGSLRFRDTTQLH